MRNQNHHREEQSHCILASRKNIFSSVQMKKTHLNSSLSTLVSPSGCWIQHLWGDGDAWSSPSGHLPGKDRFGGGEPACHLRCRSLHPMLCLPRFHLQACQSQEAGNQTNITFVLVYFFPSRKVQNSRILNLWKPIKNIWLQGFFALLYTCSIKKTACLSLCLQPPAQIWAGGVSNTEKSVWVFYYECRNRQCPNSGSASSSASSKLWCH